MKIDGKTDGVSFWLKPVLSLRPFLLLLSGKRREVAFTYLTKEEWEISRIDMFPRPDKVHKMPEKPIDIFPGTDKGI